MELWYSVLVPFLVVWRVTPFLLIHQVCTSIQQSLVFFLASAVAFIIILRSIVPRTPTGFAVTGENYTDENITVTFDWDLPQGMGPHVIVDYYIITIMPASLSHPVMTTVDNTSTWMVTLSYNAPYTVEITAVNCAGRSVPFTLNIPGYSKCLAIIIIVGCMVLAQFCDLHHEFHKTLKGNLKGNLGMDQNPDSEMHDLSYYTIYTFCLANCGPPVPPVNGSVSNLTITRVGASITYKCDIGFVPSDLLVSVCRNQALWEPDPAAHNCTLVEGIQNNN